MGVPGLQGPQGPIGDTIWTQNGSDIFYNVGSGNVGVGTDLPDARLHVAGGPPRNDVLIESGSGEGTWLNLASNFSSTSRTWSFVSNPFGDLVIRDNEQGNDDYVISNESIQFPDGTRQIGAAPASLESEMGIVRGTVDNLGNFFPQNAGFTATRTGLGEYSIVFDPPFASSPTVTVSANITTPVRFFTVGTVNILERNNWTVLAFELADNGVGGSVTGVSQADASFHFIAIGPR